MGANEEQILFLVSTTVDPLSFCLALYSLAFFLYFCNTSLPFR